MKGIPFTCSYTQDWERVQRVSRMEAARDRRWKRRWLVWLAVCLLMLFMTGLIPFSSYVFPAFAGIVLIAVSEENGVRTALMVYLSVSLLSLFLIPDQEAKLLFILLLGYYPMIRPVFQRLFRPFAYLAKLVLFNLVLVAFYYICLYVFGIPDLLDGWGSFGQYATYIVLGMANLTFLMYDSMLTQVLRFYVEWFRPKILRKIF